MQEALGFAAYPQVEAVASEGRGVTETFKLISKLTFRDLLRRLQGRPPGEGAGAVVAGTPDAAGGPAIPPEALDRRPPLTLVRPAREGEGEPAPSGGQTSRERAPAPGSDSLEPPFAEAVDAAAGTSAAAEIEERLRVLEAKFEEGWEPLRSRLSALEQRAVGAERAALTWETKLRETQDGFGRDLAALERRMAGRIPALEERLEERTSSLARDLEELQRRLSEAALQARRGPDGLSLQLAPLLEEQVRREADENWTAEIERLRQALAESLEDLSERVRKAVRG
jgi:hypothetical protein